MCKALDASIKAKLHTAGIENSQQSTFDAITEPSSVDNYRLTFVFDIQHPNWYIATKIWVNESKGKHETGFYWK
jgi:hypothetical protein